MTCAVPEHEASATSCPLVGVGIDGRALDHAVRFVEALRPSGMTFLLRYGRSSVDTAELARALDGVSVMPVCPAVDGERLAPDTLYLLPPMRVLSISGDQLRLLHEAETPAAALESLFGAIAAARRGRSIGVLLAPFRSVEMRSLGAIQEVGGATFVERPQTRAEQRHVPVIAGYAHLWLRPEEIARALPTAWAEALAPEEAGRTSREEVLTDLLEEMQIVHRIQYRPEVVEGQVATRMQVRKVSSESEYMRLLAGSSAEREELLRGILVGSTSFFRDPTLFEALRETILPPLLGTGNERRELRLWVAGCSTGEEAYSYAILLDELMRARGEVPSFRILATDLRREAIDVARAAVYQPYALAPLTSAQLERYFVEGPYGRTVAPWLRSKVFFRHHDLMTDPAFAQLDLVSCRNLLVYYDRAAQRRALMRFHYALRPQGLLVLGSSESPRAAPSLYAPLDYQNRVYTRRQVSLSDQERLRAWLPPTDRVGQP